jgi:hypothetical protein
MCYTRYDAHTDCVKEQEQGKEEEEQKGASTFKRMVTCLVSQ